MKQFVILIAFLYACALSYSQEVSSNYVGLMYGLVNKDNTLKLNNKYFLTALASGYYNTSVSSDEVEVESLGMNSTLYCFTPKKKGELNIKIYGISTSGKRANLGVFKYQVVENELPITYLKTQGAKVLYRGFKNEITPVFPSNIKIALVGENCDVKKIENEDKWIAKPGQGKNAKIKTYIVSGDTSILLKEEVFEVQVLPAPDLYLNDVVSGGVISKYDSILTVSLPYGFPLKSSFEVLSWEASIDDSSFKGSSNNFSEVMNWLESQNAPKKIAVTVKINTEGNTIRRKKGVWYYFKDFN